MFQKFIDKKPKHNGIPYEYKKFGIISFFIFRLKLTKVNEALYHTSCKELTNRSVKMSFFAMTKHIKHKFKYYRDDSRLYIVYKREVLSIFI